MAEYALEGPKWGSPTITWSFAQYNYSADASALFSRSIGVAAEQSLVQDAFTAWQSVAGVDFVEVADAANSAAPADIRVGLGNLNLATTGEVGQTNFSYDNGSILPDVIVRLQDPFYDPLTTDASGAVVYSGFSSSFYQVVLHEIGHALGLAHSSDPAAVMYPVSTPSNRDLSSADVDGIRSLYGPQTSPLLTAPFVNVVDTTTGTSWQPDMTAYSGPVSYIGYEYAYVDADNLNLSTATPNVFLRSGSGEDALQASTGENVLDGGAGSNFLVGGSGTDTFFVDGRGAGVTWSTISNFHAGDSVTLWGWKAGVSQSSWAANEGAGGFQGATLHADLTGVGSIAASMTFAGFSVAQTSHFNVSTGSVGGSDYLSVSFA